MTLEGTDLRILGLVQDDASLPLAEIAGSRGARCADVSAVFGMEQIKHTTALPLTGRR